MGTSRQTPPSSELKTFSRRLTKAIAFKKIDIAALGKKLKCSPADIRKMMAGMREPAMKKLIILAKTLECSVDYLLGLSSDIQRAGAVKAASAPLRQSGKPAPASGRNSDKAGQFIAVMPELLEADIELLMHIAGFLIDRKNERIAQFVQAVSAETKQGGKKEMPFDDDFEDDDELWEGVDDDFEDDDLADDDDDLEDDDDFEDEDFD